MKLQSRSREEPELNLTSLIDVVLMLLIFFMLSSSFVHQTAIHLHLPEARADGPAPAPANILDIAVTREGDYLVNGHALVNDKRQTLRTAIKKLIGKRRDMPVRIDADANATHQAVVTAMDVIGQLGFVKVDIATVTPKG